MSSEHWAGLPLLDAIRPEAGESVEVAILATYSLDLVALVASMLALAGLDDDLGSGSKIDFANAFEKTRGKLRVLVQAGRIAWPKKIPGLMGIMDRFVQEIKQDELHGSWHPKIALVKFASPNSGFGKWRLWVGSRNLSRTTSWESGLLITGSVNGIGQRIHGLADLGQELATRAVIENWDSKRISQEMEQVTWQMPNGVQVEEIQLLLPESKRYYPSAPVGIKRMIIASPFLDGRTLEHFGSWGDGLTERYLLGTIPELTKMKALASKPLTPFASHLLSLDAPESTEILGPIIPQTQIENPPEEEKLGYDLHAKLILAEHAQGITLWMGSANSTRRGWLGPNSEVIARLSITEAVAKGLWAFLDRTIPVTLEQLPNLPENDENEARLEAARNQVVNRWSAKQIRQSDGIRLFSEQPPHPDDPDISLEVGLLTGSLVEWPRKNAFIDLQLESKARETNFVLVRLSLNKLQLSWVQIALLDPPPDEERDNRALAAHLSPRVFLLWLRSLLGSGEMLDGGGEWQTNPGAHLYKGNSTFIWWAPTLEEILSSWTRDPETIKIVDLKIQTYLHLIRVNSQEEQTPDELKILDAFETTWNVIKAAFIEGKHE